MAQRRPSCQGSILESDSCTSRSQTNEMPNLLCSYTVQSNVPGRGHHPRASSREALREQSTARRIQGLTESDGCRPVRQTLPPAELNRESELQNRYPGSPRDDFKTNAMLQGTTEHPMAWSSKTSPVARLQAEEADSETFVNQMRVDRQPSLVQRPFDSGTFVDQKTIDSRSSAEHRTLVIHPTLLDDEVMEDRDPSDEDSWQSQVTAAMGNWTIEDDVEDVPMPESTPLIDPAVFAQDEDGDTSLHLAIISGRTDLAVVLINLAPDLLWLDLSNNLKQTALHLATVRRQPIVIRRLLSRGAKRVVYDRRGNTPLHIACLNGYLDCVQELTSSCPTPVMTSDDLGLNTSNYEGQTCLHLAVSKNHLDVIRYLVEKHKVNINQKELRRGCTVLHRAVMTPNLELLKYLLSLPSSAELIIDEPTYDGYTALQLAKLTKQTHIEQMLLLAGAQPIGFVDDWPPPQA